MLVLLISFSAFVLATNCPPSLPKTYQGVVFYDDDLLPGVFEIRAVMGIDTVGIGEVSEGNYDVDISPCMGTTGVVYFYINGIETNEEGSYNGMDDWGKIEDLDLTVDVMPPESLTCGNPPNVIDPGEECDGTNLAGRSVDDCSTGWTGTISCTSTCEIDYSNCTFGTDDSDDTPTDNSDDDDSSSGGGGGGGSSGGTATVIATSEDGLTTIATIDDTQNEIIGLSENQQPTGSGITGGVIGFVKSGVGMGFIFAVLVLIVGIGVMAFRKRSKSSNKEFSSDKETED